MLCFVFKKHPSGEHPTERVDETEEDRVMPICLCVTSCIVDTVSRPHPCKGALDNMKVCYNFTHPLQSLVKIRIYLSHIRLFLRTKQSRNSFFWISNRMRSYEK